VPSSGGDGVERQREPWVSLARPPDGDDGPSAGSEDATDLAGALLRVGNEHQPFAAVHDVVRSVGLVDGLEIEHARRHVPEPALGGTAPSDGGHLGHDVRHLELLRPPPARPRR
jgi:hypothetical protein